MASVLSAGTTSNTALNLSGDTTGILQLASNGSTTALTIDTSQNVGIGTASPSGRFHVTGGNTYLDGERVFIGGSSNNAVINSNFSVRINIDADNTGTGESFAIGHNQTTIDNNNILFLVNDSGNVGIGTSSPSQRLDVAGNTSGGYVVQILRNTNSGGYAQQIFQIGSANGTANVAYAPGIFFALGPSANDTTTPIVFQNNNATERMRIDSSGNVGIGTSSSTGKLDVVSGSSLVGRFYNNAGRGIVRVDGSSDSSFQAYRNGSLIGWFQTDGSGTEINTGTVGTHPFIFYTNNTERMRITSGGNVLINTTAVVVDGTSRLAVSNTTTNGVAAEFSNNTSGTCAVAINNSGAATSTLINWIAANAYRSAVTWNGTNIIYGTPSDQRLKENIVDSSSALPLINDIKIRSFDWKENGNHIEFGVIAQELESVMPEAVLKGKDNEDGSIKESWSVDTSTLVPAMIKAIQELKAELDATKAEVAALKGVN